MHGKTIVSASTRELKKAKGLKKTDEAKQLGGILGEKAKKQGVLKAVVDRGSYKYHGRVKAVVEAAREAGLQI